jgi:hypothetical protein
MREDGPQSDSPRSAVVEEKTKVNGKVWEVGGLRKSKKDNLLKPKLEGKE